MMIDIENFDEWWFGRNWDKSSLGLHYFYLSSIQGDKIEHHCQDDDDDDDYDDDDDDDYDKDKENVYSQEIQRGEAGEGVGLDTFDLVCVDQQQLGEI